MSESGSNGGAGASRTRWRKVQLDTKEKENRPPSNASTHRACRTLSMPREAPHLLRVFFSNTYKYREDVGNHETADAPGLESCVRGKGAEGAIRNAGYVVLKMLLLLFVYTSTFSACLAATLATASLDSLVAFGIGTLTCPWPSELGLRFIPHSLTASSTALVIYARGDAGVGGVSGR